MFFSKFVNPLGLAALAASVCASPVVPAVGLADLAVVRAAAPAVNVNNLESRRMLVDARTVNDKLTEASFDLGHSWSGDVLFDGRYTDGQGGSVGLNVVCKTCYTKGTIGATIINMEELKPSLRLDFSDMEAYVDLSVAVTDSATYTVNLFTSNTPIGFGVAGIDCGIIFAVDLVFSLSAEIDISGGGFYVSLPSGAYVESSLAEGEVSGSFFKGISAKTLPVTVSSGTATFKCDLRLRTQAGIEGDIAIIGAGLVAGVYINIIELVTIIETSEKCGLQCREFIDLNVGAFARAAIEIDYKTFGFAPTISTTLFSLPTATQCIGSLASEAASIIATATAISGGSGTFSAGHSASPAVPSGVSVGATVSAGVSASATATLSLGGGGVAHLGNSTLSFAGSSSGALSATSTTSLSAATSTAATTTHGDSNTNITATATATDLSLVTSTVLTTKTYTITSCKATVVNCPASMQTAITVTQTYTNKYTNGGNTATETTTTTAALVVATTTAITDVIILVPCPTPIINTFFFPSTTTAFTTVDASAATSAGSVVYATPGTTLAVSAVTTAAAIYTPPAAVYTIGTGVSAGFTASKNGSLSGSYSPTATTPGGTVVTAGAAIDKLGGSLAAAAGIFAAAMLL
ncbi:hypothetical protein F503_05272 [Ophiostoma piceae UAMH 11346]|uniref:Uncharacterized protein n=1 Tax=Ophiostoma piceae (strain UAMH 11346) TaxID=1262450 RepID=S3CB93_OPHP1|nr:hypothetical protein F503_05272 [Ophiostoma piceae UAMH 11346]